MPKNREIKQKIAKFEFSNVDAETGTFEGYASRFFNVDDVGDVVLPGAFTKTLQEQADRIKIHWNHGYFQSELPIGKPVSITEDNNGLKVIGKISDTAKGRDVLQLLRDGVVNEMSIGYEVIKDEWKSGIRYLKEVRLWEVSIVDIAANKEALITSVKAVDKPESEVKASDFFSAYKEQIESEKPFLMMGVLNDTIRKYTGRTFDEEKTEALLTPPETKLEILKSSVMQFAQEMIQWLDDAFAMGLLVGNTLGWKSLISQKQSFEVKELEPEQTTQTKTEDVDYIIKQKILEISKKFDNIGG